MPDIVECVPYTLLLKNIQLVVSRLFAGDNWLSPDILLVTTGCQQTKKSGDNRLSADLANFKMKITCQSYITYLIFPFFLVFVVVVVVVVLTVVAVSSEIVQNF